MAGGRAAHAFLTGEAGEQFTIADEVHHKRAGVLEQARVLVGAQNLGGREGHAGEAGGGPPPMFSNNKLATPPRGAPRERGTSDILYIAGSAS